MTFHLPLPHLNLTINPEYGLWIGVLASSASLAAFLSSFLGKHSFITYKFVNYPADRPVLTFQPRMPFHHLQICELPRRQTCLNLSTPDAISSPTNL